jgi:AcrR family transcriptional regulator
VRYHFPTKADLMATVTDRYALRLLDALGKPAAGAASTRAKTASPADAHIAACCQDTSTSLGAVPGSVVSQLSNPVFRNIRDFCRQLLAWTIQALRDRTGSLTAALVIFLLQAPWCWPSQPKPMHR